MRIATNTLTRTKLIARGASEVLLIFLTLAGLFSGTNRLPAEEPAEPKESQIKAAFVFNFTKFVEWPAARFAAADSPIIIGVFGKSPVAQQLPDAIKDRKVNGRGIVFKPIEKIEDTKSVHLLFVPASADSEVVELLKVMKGTSVLTIGESEVFAKAGGMINFVREGDKVRFEINTDSAEQAGLKISAQLQKLAKSVRRKS